MSTFKHPLEKTIEQLLMRHECVILPGFGGFIVRDSPCNFNAAKDQIKPFARHIFFNPHLQQNDGLLSNEIAGLESMSFGDASEKCRIAIDDLKQSIESAGSKVFGNLGTFFKGQENIWFAPSTTLNLSLDSYGLSPVDIRLITESSVNKAITIEKQITEEAIADRKPIESTEIKRPGITPWLVAASIALLVHFIYLKTEQTDPSRQEAALISLDSAPNTDSLNTIPSQTETEDSISGNESIDTAVIPSSDLIPVIEPLEPTKPTEPEETVNPSEQNAGKEIPVISDAPVIVQDSSANQTTETVYARYIMESNALYHMKDLVKVGKSARVEFKDNWYFVIISETVVQ